MDCTCEFSPEGHLIRLCGCVERRKAEPRGTVEKRQVQDFECQCLDSWTGRRLSRLRRHKHQADCIPQEAVAAFMEAKGLHDTGLARALLFIEQFAPSPRP